MVQKKHIIHFVYKRYDWHKVSDVRYLCNSACNTTKSKSTEDWSKVTCQNCLELSKPTLNSIKRKMMVHCDSCGFAYWKEAECPMCGNKVTKQYSTTNEVSTK